MWRLRLEASEVFWQQRLAASNPFANISTAPRLGRAKRGSFPKGKSLSIISEMSAFPIKP